MKQTEKKYIIVFVDRFTKMFEAVATRETISQKTAKAEDQLVISRFGWQKL